jgi:fatty acid amide hydrolase 2
MTSGAVGAAADRSTRLPITRRSAVSLAASIRRRELSAAEVVEAHIARLRDAGPALNAIAADRFEVARHEATVVDEQIRESLPDAVLAPLLGVPFTVKESIAVAGMPQAAGIMARQGFRTERNAPTVQRLEDAGAIVLGVTNTSELTLWIESSNRLYGRTGNPYDPRRTAGGSSGGEGAAVGSGGSPFGIGSDIGGSIRIPALFCGVFGHKPSAGLVPNSGMYPPSSEANGRLLGVGPITRRGEDLMPVLRAIAGPDGEDPVAQSLELGDPAAVSLAGLRVVLPEDTSVRSVDSALHDARERAAGALAAAGAALERVSLRSWRGAVLPFLTALSGGAAESTSEMLATAGAEPLGPGRLLAGRGPHTLPTRLVLLSELLPQNPDSRQAKRLLDRARELGDELREVIGDGVLLHTAFRRPAPRHGGTVGRPWLLGPSAVFNLAGVPVTEVPLGLSRTGLPLGVQVAAGLGRDHVSIAVALELERVFGGWTPPSTAASIP